MKSLTDELEERRSERLYRFRRVAEEKKQTELSIDGQTITCFCSNDYLGLANDDEVRKAFIEGAQTWGTGSGGAHLVNGHTTAHHKLEQELAEFTGRERALIYSTGYMANLGCIQALLNKDDLILEDRLNHASLLDAGLLSRATLKRYAHLDIEHLGTLLKQSPGNEKLIVSDGVFSMDGDIAPVDVLSKLARNQKAWLMIDDAHGFGVLGDKGRGTTEQFKLKQNDVPILVGTFGKAFGTFGAFVAGSDALIETLIQKSRTYIYTTALPAAIAEATRCSLKILQTQSWRQDKLQQNIEYFRTHAQQLGITLSDSTTAIQPILIGENKASLDISEQLFSAGILVTAIRPPTVPHNTARLRITFSSAHNTAQIDKLLDGLHSALSRQTKS